MAQFIRRLALATIHRTTCQIPTRTIFSSSGIGIDNFKSARDQHASRYAPSLDSFKKRFLESIDQSNSQVLAEDLRNMIMSATTDQEVDAVIQALKKYSTNKVKFTDYHFGSPVMRLLYIQNKSDLALQLYMDDSLKTIFNDSASALVLMNRLIEDKRYDDALKVFEYGSERGFTTTSGRAFPTDVIMLAIECLYRQNTKESLEKAKELVSKVRESNADLNNRTTAMTALLAIEQGDLAFAMEILGAIRGQNLTTVQNLRAICYADMGRIEQALNVVQLLSDQKSSTINDRRKVFPLVMRHIRTAVEKGQDQDLLTRFEELSKSIMKNNRLSTTDLPEFVSQPINRRGPMRRNSQQNIRNSFQRTVNNAGRERDREQDGYNNDYNNNNNQQRRFNRSNDTSRFNNSPRRNDQQKNAFERLNRQ